MLFSWSRSMTFFYVTQATLGPLKLTQPDRLGRWSFQTLQCVAVKTVKAVSLAWTSDMHLSGRSWDLAPVTTLAAAVPPFRPFPGSHHGSKKPAKADPKAGNERLSCTVRHATTTRFTYRMYGLCSACVSSYCCMRAIMLSYAGPNILYCPHTTELLPAYDIPHNKRAWSWNQARLFSSLIGSDHDNGHMVCLKRWLHYDMVGLGQERSTLGDWQLCTPYKTGAACSTNRLSPGHCVKDLIVAHTLTAVFLFTWTMWQVFSSVSRLCEAGSALAISLVLFQVITVASYWQCPF